MNRIFSKLFKNSVFNTFKRNLANVTVKQGKLEGLEKKLKSGKTYYSFKGIPYAKPPLGPLRFRAPEPPEAWLGTKKAHEHGNVCPHFDSFSGEFVGDEDCLYLNVYTPHRQGKLLPVIVYVHGGGYIFESGNSNLYGPEVLLEEDVILVTINFRYEVLGFLCLHNEMAPGNAGLKDQVAALKWIQENIAQFGGDPTNVSLFGGSAGGGSITQHYLSPMSKNLVHKFIAQSGNFLCHWSCTDNAVERARALCKLLGGNPQNEKEIFDFINKQPAQKLSKVSIKLMSKEESVQSLLRYFCPVVEEYKPDEDQCFMPKPPMELFKDNLHHNNPFLYGYNSWETLYRVKRVLYHASEINKDMSCRITARLRSKITDEQAKLFGEKIRKFYFDDDKGVCEENISKTLDLDADFMMVQDSITFVNMIAKHTLSPIYFNRFSFEGDLNVYKKIFIGKRNLKGATHSDDIFYLFSNSFEEGATIDERTNLMRRKMARMWANFAKYGNPTPSKDDLIDIIWKPVTSQECNFLEIDEPLTMKKNPEEARYKFWSDLYREAGSNIDPMM